MRRLAAIGHGDAGLIELGASQAEACVGEAKGRPRQGTGGRAAASIERREIEAECRCEPVPWSIRETSSCGVVKYHSSPTPLAVGRPEPRALEGDAPFIMDTALYVIAAVLIAVGLVGAIVPLLPGIPLIFGGVWLIAGLDHYRHLGLWWLIGIALIGAVGLAMDLLAGALGAQRVGASRQAVWGAMIGTVIGLFFGLPGLLLAPFIGALAGETHLGQ